jgi:putative transposase
MQREDGSFRKLRKSHNEPGEAHELTFTCYKRLPLLSKNRTRVWFVDALDRARARWKFDLWAYVIMPEHAHVLLVPCEQDYDVSLILKAIKQSVARRAIQFLRDEAPGWLEHLAVPTSKEETEYRFWQAGGGYDRNIDQARTAWNSVEYIHRNPVRRGLVQTPGEWEWSSARWYAGEANVRLMMDGNPPRP